jgi:hypothetical protein
LSVNAAETVLAALSVTEQAPVPVQAPDQPAKVEEVSGAAVSVTMVPALYVAEQVDPQDIPAGEDVTVPAPVPDLATVRL